MVGVLGRNTMNRECSDQTARVYMLIWIFSVHTWHKSPFISLCIIYISVNPYPASLAQKPWCFSCFQFYEYSFLWRFITAGLGAQFDAHPTGEQEVAGSIPTGLTTFFHEDWSWNIFKGHFSPFTWIKKSSCQFLM